MITIVSRTPLTILMKASPTSKMKIINQRRGKTIEKNVL